jgi:DNA damage-inducible protein 1
MKIILTTLDGSIYPVEVSSDIELINLKALCEQETNIAANQMSLTHNGILLAEDNRTLESYSIAENDILMVQKMISNIKIILRNYFQKI